jgi:hypothetical protein
MSNNVAFIAYLFLKVFVTVQPCFWNRKTEFQCAILSRVWHYTIVSIVMFVGGIALTWAWFWTFDWLQGERSLPEPSKQRSRSTIADLAFQIKEGRMSIHDQITQMASGDGIMVSGPKQMVQETRKLGIARNVIVYCESFV